MKAPSKGCVCRRTIAAPDNKTKRCRRAFRCARCHSSTDHCGQYDTKLNHLLCNGGHVAMLRCLLLRLRASHLMLSPFPSSARPLAAPAARAPPPRRSFSAQPAEPTMSSPTAASVAMVALLLLRSVPRRSTCNAFQPQISFSRRRHRLLDAFQPHIHFSSRRRYRPPSALSSTHQAVDDGNVSKTIAQQLEEENVQIQESLAVNDIPRKFVPIPFAYHQLLIATVDSLTNLGVGICRVPLPSDAMIDPHPDPNDVQHDNRGWVVFVPNVIPGELVKLSIYRNHKSYSDADLVEVLEPSPDRVEPRCNLFDVCGGCQYQHMAIETQRQWKTRQVSELYSRVGGLEEGVTYPTVLPALGTDATYHYRSKITPHYEAPKKNQGGLIDNIGFKQKGSRRLVDVPYCHIATENINEKLTEVREAKFAEAKEGRLKRPNKGATILLRDANEGVITDNNEWVTTTVKDLTFRLKAGNFFQNNPYMLPVMDDLVVDAARKSNGRGEAMTHLIDCYCGSGLFCLGSSTHFDVCVGIEVNDLAVQEAKGNADLNGITNCKFVSASAEAIFESEDAIVVQREEGETTILVRDFPRDNTAVVVDPPRKGCSEEFLEQLYAFGPSRVVYMSCDPATQARDAKGLVGAGYEITSIQPLDLFPQTRHIECLTIFERKGM